jgi:hypothetical protein
MISKLKKLFLRLFKFLFDNDTNNNALKDFYNSVNERKDKK